MVKVEFVAKASRVSTTLFSELGIGDPFTLELNNGCKVFIKIDDYKALELDAYMIPWKTVEGATRVYPRTVKILVEKL